MCDGTGMMQLTKLKLVLYSDGKSDAILSSDGKGCVLMG